MADPPELWTFLAANLVVVGIGGLITVLSFVAYRANRGAPAFRNATVGFGLLTVGSVGDLIYQAGIKGDYHLTGRELLLLQTVEGVLIAAGLGILFYSIYQYRPGRSAETRVTDVDSPD